MAVTKTIKGQAWISPDGKLLQEQTLITTKGTSSNVVALISDIWKDLLSEGTYKYNAKKTFFYWEYKQTDLSGEEEITVMIECPKPKDGLFTEPYEPEKATGEYAKTWLTKFKTAQENYEATATIQPKKITFPDTEYVSTEDGELKVIKERIIEREDLSDITNLLFSFQ